MKFLALLAAVFLVAAAPQRVDGVRVIPDHFLRGFDPVTVFFPADAGPLHGGPEDRPARVVSMRPEVPGQWRWLGPRVLQFRPTERWEPLRKVAVGVGGTTTDLVPLLPIPLRAGPADRAGGVAGLDRIALTFPVPVDEAALARLLTIELRPLPGLAGPAAQVLTAQDFTITAQGRTGRGDPQVYVVGLHQPIPDGQMALLRLRLADVPGLDVPSFAWRLRSAAPFALTGADCLSGFGSSVEDGLRRCAPSDDADGAALGRGIQLRFSARPAALDAVAVRDALRVSPHVDGLRATVDGDALDLAGRFQADTAYTLDLAPGAIRDARGRVLGDAAAPIRFAFAAPRPGLRWDASQGIVERLGPQMVPLRGQGYDRADIRIYPIDPADRDFWPFPQPGLVTRDAAPPPLPGAAPAAWDQPFPIGADDMALRLRALGSPSVSEIVDLPIRPGGVEAKFGLDLAPLLRRIAGAGEPGTYLVGLRPVDARDRHWIRLQVTDLSLTTVSEADAVRFSVTSLATAQPVAGAEIEVQGFLDRRFVTLQRGTTDAQGGWRWAVAAHAPDTPVPQIARIVVRKGADVVVLDPRRPPEFFANGNWQRADRPWLGWAASGALAGRTPPPQTLCHVYTERPIYRPEEPVLIAGMIRRYDEGALAFATGHGLVVVTGPDKQEWKLPVTLDDAGGFHVRFDAKTDATGDYAVQYLPTGAESGCGAMSFKKQAYRLPSFEVLLDGPDRTKLDRPFDVGLVARWFAGGLVAGRPITWRVTQYPYVWSPPGQTGFAFSSDSRFSAEADFRSTPVLNRVGQTDAGGSARLTLDPTIEPTAQPRQYSVEATVTGDDGIQVRSVKRVVALPPFVLGVKLARYIARPGAIDPEVIAVDGTGQPVAGLPMTATLIRRNWNSVLQASDFAAGSAKYDTQVIDETVATQKLVSTGAAQRLHFPAAEAGVYIVQLSAADQVGRTQTIRVDSFMAGDTPVTWARPPARTATVTTDKPEYDPGDTATLLIESPFQNARALAVVEEPEGGFRTGWVDIGGGVGRFQVPIRKSQAPRLAVHFLIMRGRLAGTAPAAGAPFDQGKPTTIAATAWVRVRPVDNEVKASFTAPASARPGQAVDLVLHLADAAGHPLAGEATVWMVDQAVLSLAREQALDPLPQFIVDRPSRMVARDTRNLAFGIIPLAESPGGDEGGDRGLANISVRKNFTPVPIYVPRVMVGPDGTATIHVVLPDTLTVYMLRAKAISGPDRFGYGTGQMRIRQPVIAQPVLPRFVRPGDSFTASVLGRVVQGPGGAGVASIHVEGLTVAGDATQAVTLSGAVPARAGFAVTVPEPKAGTATARIRLQVVREADHVGDAVQLDLPIRPDRPVLRQRQVFSLRAGGGLTVPALGMAVRPGSYRRTITVAADPLLVRLVGGLAYLRSYPFGCTEQRMALAGSELALKPYGPILGAAGLTGRINADVAGTVAAIGQNVDGDGLVAYWPNTHGSVLLTAWAYEFLLRAEQAGLPGDRALRTRLGGVLVQALRSDYPHLFNAEAARERVAALLALADGGVLEPGYAAELARRAVELPTESLAQIVRAVVALPVADRGMLPGLTADLWRRVNLVQRDGQPVYGGLADMPASPLILPSEARSLAQVTEAVAAASPDDPRLALLRAGLLGIAGGQGWGSTNATAAALRALAASWQKPDTTIGVTMQLPGGDVTHDIDAATPLVQAVTDADAAIAVRAPAAPDPLAVLVDTRGVPAEPGWQATAAAHGFVLTRTLYLVPATGPMQKLAPGADGFIHVRNGDVVEEADEVVSPDDHTNVAIRLPLPAGMEPLNPALATAPADAAPSAAATRTPDWTSYGDDEVLAVYTQLPKGNDTLRFRMRAMVDGSFTAPPATAETMYQAGVDGSSSGLRVVVGG
jgi:uncharacterized protein YfaS (alpha-2-macroglobulin family)